MKTSFSRRTAVAVSAALALCSVSPSFAQDKEHNFRLALQNPKGHPLEVGAQKFADLVAAKSGGKMKVSVFPGVVLGGDAPNVSSLQGGVIPLVLLNSGILTSQVKDFVVFDFPFMFASEKEADAVVDGPFGKAMHAKLETKGIVGLAFFELGFRNITNSKRPIAKVEDVAGLKLRVIPNAINIDWVKALGGNPTPLAFPEVYTALEQKAIDGQENPLSVILANKFAEVQKYLTITNHQYNPQSLIFSKKIWDTLSTSERKILQDAALEAATFQRQASREASQSTLDALKKAGMQVNEFSPAEQDKLRARLKPVIDKHGAEISETAKALETELGKLR